MCGTSAKTEITARCREVPHETIFATTGSSR